MSQHAAEKQDTTNKEENTLDNIMFSLGGDVKEIDNADLEDVERYAAFIQARKQHTH